VRRFTGLEKSMPGKSNQLTSSSSSERLAFRESIIISFKSENDESLKYRRSADIGTSKVRCVIGKAKLTAA